MYYKCGVDLKKYKHVGQYLYEGSMYPQSPRSTYPHRFISPLCCASVLDITPQLCLYTPSKAYWIL